MATQINTGNHVSRKVGYLPIPSDYVQDVEWALERAAHIAKTIPAANTYFSTLGFFRSLTQVLEDSETWVHYSPRLKPAGENYVSPYWAEIAISESQFQIGRKAVLGTLIHELAHAAGAPGYGKAAETALVYCGLGTFIEKDTLVDDPNTEYRPNLEG